MEHSKHIWNFSTIGGVKRVNLETGADLVHLHELDPKLWTALSCPASDLEIDRKTLELIDADKDGQIRVPEVIGAVNWIISVIKDPADLLKQADELPLSSINSNTEEGKVLLDSARVILKNLGRENAASLTVADTSDTVQIFAGTKFNGDGVITGDSAGGDAALAAAISEIMQYAGAVTDRSGKMGITQEILQAFFEQCAKYAQWYGKKEADPGAIMPFGAESTAAYENYCAIRAKVDDFFLRGRLAAFDPQSTAALNLQTERVAAITNKDLSGSIDEIATYPLAGITANASLPLMSGINPAWQSQLATFRELTVAKLFPGRQSISEEDWKKISQTFAPYAQWMAEKDGGQVEALGIDRIRGILAGREQAQLSSLIEKDKELEHEANAIMQVDRLVRYYRDLFRLLKNFVTFFDFYTPGTKAVFQAGTLYIDQRSCDLCIKVRDLGKQANLASFSGMYLIYCECVSKATGEKMTIVAALTNGDVDDLMVGRNAIFYDRHGLDWDATVIKVTENPTSIRQAFFAPYNRLSRLIETQVNKAAAAADEKNAARMTKSVGDAPAKMDDTKKEPPPPFDVGKFAGIFAAIGLAVGAIGTILASVIGGFMKLTWWKMPLALLGILLVISGPSMILAYVKLRKRNLAPILDANGWAINARVKINIQFGRALTQLATLPRGAKINLNDPFTKKKSPLIPALLFLVVAGGVVLYLLWKNDLIHIRLPK